MENDDYLDEPWLQEKPDQQRVMLRRADFVGATTIARGSADYRLLPRTFTGAKA